MILIEISDDAKHEITTKHFQDIQKNSKKIIEHLEALKKYDALYNYLVDIRVENDESIKGLRIENLKPLICANSKKQLIDQIIVMENLLKGIVFSQKANINDIRRDILVVFEKVYTNFSNRKWAYDFLRILNNDVCPYCNRTFTMFINNKQKPEFDHYFPKNMYPYLTISIFNLIPICSNCNRGKSSNHVSIDKQNILYPYEEEFANDITFTTDFDKIESWTKRDEQFAIKLVGENEDVISAYNNAFKIDELYSLHSDYARDLYKKSIITNEDFIINLYRSFPELFDSVTEVKELVYGVYLDKAGYGKRPLSKMINDLLNEITKK